MIENLKSIYKDKTDILLLAIPALALFFYHLLTAAFSSYGYFIDEFYYIACAKRPALGYVDHPPLSALLLTINRFLLGDSLLAIRILPALCAAGLVITTGLMARTLGGTRSRLIITAIAVIAMPVYMVITSFYSMNSYELVIWTAICFLSIRMVQKQEVKYWLAIGVLVGLGLQMKHTMIVYVLALLAGMLLTKTRQLLWNRWSVYGGLIAVVLLLPNLFWQYAHDFPSLEFYKNAMMNKNIPRGIWGIITDQMLFTNPVTLPLWLSGLIFFLFSAKGKSYRYLGLTFLFLLLSMIISQSSRPDRIGAIYTVLFAGGAVAWQEWFGPRIRRYAIGALSALLFCGAILLLPFSTPLLPPHTTGKYLAKLGLKIDLEKGKMGEALPQWLADRLGWRELALEVSKGFHALSEQERKHTCLISTNYAHAGAMELWGEELDLPNVYGTHNSYHLWGPPPDSITTIIAVHVNRRELEHLFNNVVQAGAVECEFCTRPQRRTLIYIARGRKFSWQKEWPEFKNYN